MLVSAAEVLRERGAAGVTIDEVLARSGAPRGSVYHHFPEGRSQILREALDYAAYEISTSLDEAAKESTTALLRRFAALWENALLTSDYTAGCPVLAAAVVVEPARPSYRRMRRSDRGRMNQRAIVSWLFGSRHCAVMQRSLERDVSEATNANLREHRRRRTSEAPPIEALLSQTAQ